MVVALDYDGTYDLDPELWNFFIAQASMRGHKIICVTMRSGKVPVPLAVPVYYTAGKAKVEWCREQGLTVNVWIDDMPIRLLKDAPPLVA